MQLATEAGAVVTGVCSTAKVGRVRALGGRWLGRAGRRLAVPLANATTRQTLHGLMAREAREVLLALVAYVEAGTFSPVIGRTFALDGAADALAHLGEGQGYGMVVVRIG